MNDKLLSTFLDRGPICDEDKARELLKDYPSSKFKLCFVSSFIPTIPFVLNLSSKSGSQMSGAAFGIFLLTIFSQFPTSRLSLEISIIVRLKAVIRLNSPLNKASENTINNIF